MSNPIILKGWIVVSPSLTIVARGRIVASTQSIRITASTTPRGFLYIIHWYTGVFKYTSQGFFRAVYKTRKFITSNRNLV